MNRPRVNTKCVADSYAAPGERIIEYNYPNGKGGLISFSLDDIGRPRVDLYRHDWDVIVYVGKAATLMDAGPKLLAAARRALAVLELVPGNHVLPVVGELRAAIDRAVSP